jgi:hypothetical protein
MSSATDSQNMGGSPLASTAPEVRDELITYLSTEIQTHSQYLLTFRSRISFTVLVGPFLILGSFLVAAKPTARNPWGTTQLVFGIGAAVLYLILGIYGSTIDQHGNDQCNRWRRALVKVSTGQALDEKDLVIKDKVWWVYLIGYLVVFLVFFFTGGLMLSLFPVASLRG